MAKKSSKIYLKNGESIYKFLWAQVSLDGSMMIGSSYNGMQLNHAVFDEKKTYRESDFVSGEAINNPKITFHTSGHFKTSTRIGLTNESIDRCTVKGTPLDSIKEPIRMMEILLPEELSLSNKKIKDTDLIIDITPLTNRPVRCSVTCCELQYFHENIDNLEQFVDTSMIECTKGIEDGKRAWIFTLRQSKNDKHFSNEFIFFIPGKIKWGNISNAI